MKARFCYRLGHERIYDHMMLDGLEDAYDTRKAMGVFSKKCIDKYQFSRKELDDFPLTSLTRAKKTNEDRTFSKEIVPITVKYTKETIEVIHDENALKAKPEKISHLKLAFKADGSVTAENSSSISDGAAAALILMGLSDAKKLNIRPMEKIVGHFTHAQEPTWFTTAPINTIQSFLGKIGWKKRRG